MDKPVEDKPTITPGSDARFQALLDAAVDAIVVIDHRGSIQTFNAAAEKIFGYREEEVIGRNVRCLMPEPFSSQHDSYLEHYLDTGKARIIGTERQAMGRRKDGSEFPLGLAIGEVRGETPPRFVGLLRDITAQIEADRALRQERDRAQGYLDLAAAILLGLDDKGRVTLINKAGCKVLGFEETELLGQDWFEACIQADERAQMRGVFDEIMSGNGEPFDAFENWVTCKSGEQRLIVWHNSLVHDDGGQLAGTLSSGEDITDRRQAEERLLEREEELRLFFQNAPMGAAVSDLDQRIVNANSTLCRMLGHDGETLQNTELTSLVHPDDRVRFAEHIAHIMAQRDAVVSVPLRFLDAEGGAIPCNLSAGVAHDASGNPKFVIAQIEDLSDRVRSEEEARQLRRRLAHVSRLSTLGEMAASIAHEINQPLTAIATYAQAGRRMLQAGRADPGDLGKTCEQISDQAQRAGQVIRSLRSFVRQQASVRERLDCNSVVREVVKLAELDAQAHHIPMHLDLEDELPPIMADRVQVQQVVLNLIRNAIEANLEAKTRQPIRIVSRKDGEEFIEVSVADEGPGVLADMHERVFTPFQTHKPTGMGLGLSMCKSIIAAHGGKMAFDSVPGVGARFFFTIPTAITS